MFLKVCFLWRGNWRIFRNWLFFWDRMGFIRLHNSDIICLIKFALFWRSPDRVFLLLLFFFFNTEQKERQYYSLPFFMWVIWVVLVSRYCLEILCVCSTRARESTWITRWCFFFKCIFFPLPSAHLPTEILNVCSSQSRTCITLRCFVFQCAFVPLPFPHLPTQISVFVALTCRHNSAVVCF